MNKYAAHFGTSKDASAMSRAILPKLTAKWKTKSNMGPHNKGVSEQIRQTKWINKQQKPDLEIMAEMLIRTVIEAAAVAGGARPWRRKADATADGGGGLPAEDSTAAGIAWQCRITVAAAGRGGLRFRAITAANLPGRYRDPGLGRSTLGLGSWVRYRRTVTDRRRQQLGWGRLTGHGTDLKKN